MMLSSEALEALVERAVEKVVASAPRLVDRHGIAELLSVSASQVDALRKKGMPTVMVGQNVRFEPAAVVAWLKGSGSEAA
jgi:phage terminase Nu1 subunit (DNA packaging protein)